ncbi:PE-PPE domain-containing protein [Nocardia aurea]|uniref:PE-PPE domain-containing protein n=1 Tax=Nocardia aurea TaxID=2144174 RepID=UPI0033B4B6AB
MITCFWLPGTGFSTGPDGISQAFGAALDRDRFEFVPLRYSAAYGGLDVSYAVSVAQGKQVLLDAIRATPNRVIIGGYSQGAGIAGSLAQEIARGKHRDVEVLACALIADPLRPEGQGAPGLPAPGGYGIAGERFIDPSLPAFWASAPGDAICALPAGNPLRSIADLSEWYSLRSPGDAFVWMEKLKERAFQRRWQRWWSLENWRSWSGAIGFATGYLTGRHTTAYLTEDLAVGLAAVVNREVR